MSRQPYMSLAVISTRSAGAIGPACFTAMTCRACLGPTTHSKATSVIQGAACCGPQAKRASRSARCNAKARGNSSRAPQQRPSYSMPCVKPHLRIWRKKGSALLRIANGSACRADPCDRLKLNSINCVSNGRHYSLQAQGDFRGIAPTPSVRACKDLRNDRKWRLQIEQWVSFFVSGKVAVHMREQSYVVHCSPSLIISVLSSSTFLQPQ